MMRFLIALIFGVLLGMFAREADAGIFRNRCHRTCGTVHIPYAAPVQQTDVQNFVFNNAFPYPQQGNTLYGVQSIAATYADSPALFMDRAARFTERAFDLAQIGQEGFNANGQLALQLNDAADRRQKNAMLALAAMENSGIQTQQQVYAIEVRNGQMRFIQPGEGQPPSLQQQAEPVTATTCANCHTADAAASHKGVVLDGSAAFDVRRAMKAVISGRMPPKSNLTDDQKAAITAGLCELLKPGGLE